MRPKAALLMLLCMSSPVQAKTPKNALTLDPLAIVFTRAISIDYERIFGSVGLHVTGAVVIGESIYDKASEGEEAQRVEANAFGVGWTLGLRYYPWSAGLTGAYLNPYVSFAHTYIDGEDETLSGFGWSVGMIAGWSWVLGDSFAFSLGGGAGWCDTRLETQDGAAFGQNGVCPTVRVAVGAAF